LSLADSLADTPQANDDDEVDGIMVYYPIYGGRQVNLASLTFETRRSTDGQDQYLQSVVSAVKDVEGLNHQFLFNLYHK
jgi:methylenetetrahydrofolate dehydrogenase (NAD+)